ncbi:hypothetical protein [uncultured Sphingomonas sp.]|uniref:hypothetical protein n=1 Tax=uncultured Sphingomonas sp. TaxID=158754 RepID=UPI0035CB12F4
MHDRRRRYRLASIQGEAGGFTLFIVTWLITRTGDHAISGAWLSAAAAISLAAVLLAHRQEGGRDATVVPASPTRPQLPLSRR